MSLDNGKHRLVIMTAGLWALYMTAFSTVANAGNQYPNPFLQDVYFGIFDHATQLTSSGIESGTDLNLEAQFRPIKRLSNPLLPTPKPHLGVHVNLNSQTDQLYTGLTWEFVPRPKNYINFSLGISAHNGELTKRDPERRALGRRLLIRAGLELGWLVNPKHGLSIAYDHISNGPISGVNQGIDNIGARYRYRRSAVAQTDSRHNPAEQHWQYRPNNTPLVPPPPPHTHHSPPINVPASARRAGTYKVGYRPSSVSLLHIQPEEPSSRQTSTPKSLHSIDRYQAISILYRRLLLSDEQNSPGWQRLRRTVLTHSTDKHIYSGTANQAL